MILSDKPSTASQIAWATSRTLPKLYQSAAKAIRPPKPQRPSEWAANHRYMPRTMTASPGPWKNERTPYLAGIMDAVAETGIDQVVFLKAVQVGFSEALRNVLGYWIDHDPGPTLLVMPSEQSAKELVDERIRPLLQDTPKLKEYVSDAREDNKVHHTRLSSMSVFIGWAGSPQALASRPIRYVVFDEVDKYPPFSGKEADPISLGLKRLTTYGTRAKAIIGSTPTTRVGAIWSAWERCTQRRHFMVPCPKCGERQALKWSQVKFPEREDGESQQDRAERIESSGLARYECEYCGDQWTNTKKNAAVRLGEWQDDGGAKRRVGFHINSIYSPWVSLSTLAGEWLRAQADPAALMDFANSRLAEPFEEQASTTSPSVIEEKSDPDALPWQIPAWSLGTFGAVDVQKHVLYYTIRSWGAGGRSQLVAAGQAGTFEELDQIMFGGRIASVNGESIAADCVAIDARYRTNEVMAWAASRGGRIIPVMGSAHDNAAPIRQSQVKGYPGVVQRTLNTGFFKDFLHGLIHADDATQWTVHSTPSPDYCKQMASEHKVHDPRTRRYLWEPISKGADNHWWDCEVYQVFLAQAYNMFQMTGGDEPQPQVAGNQGTQEDDNDWLSWR